MNDIDKKILSLLQTNADIPIAELSKKINLSPSPCWLRINKLYKQGYIKKKVAVIDRAKINLSTVAFVQIRTSQHNMTLSKKFIEGVKEMYEVVEFYRLSGTTEYLLKVIVPSIDKFDEYYKKLTDKVDLSDVTTSYSMEDLKQPSNLPLHYI